MSFWTDLVGKKPTVPTLDKLNLGTEAGKAISANERNLTADERLVSGANLFSRQQITDMLNATIPGFSGIQTQASENIESLLQGNIPQDVQDAIARSDAASALTGGYGGTQASRNLQARDLGLTSLQLTKEGLSSAESWTRTMASLYEPSMMNVQSMFISPMQQYQTDNEQNLQQFQREWMQNQINAMPAPWAEDLKQFVYRAMAAYSGTSVPDNPYGKYGSFGSGIEGGGGVGGGMGFGAGSDPAGYGSDPGGELSLGGFGFG